ncbi:hypothetical protein GH714_007571 [Hevea brasiliensis]|uniref:Uncharacterized protein n=1 Tax=Hevea brasiliensis TaxID=3981 RepID=A0A6A6KBG9_HEVBR|nr:hypothetical protein GH714_007571 [Hevea brasiliensis]
MRWHGLKDRERLPYGNGLLEMCVEVSIYRAPIRLKRELRPWVVLYRRRRRKNVAVVEIGRIHRSNGRDSKISMYDADVKYTNDPPLILNRE